jgi:hypothetical protein
MSDKFPVDLDTDCPESVFTRKSLVPPGFDREADKPILVQR